jgi:hypothetical protein
LFFRLPPEIRLEIDIFALPKGEWKVEDSETFAEEGFPRGVGDPSGFYYPLSRDLVALRVNKQMRQEALPFAYRRTVFHLDDIDSVVRFLVAVGTPGRDNIESLCFAWEGMSDPASAWNASPDPGAFHSTLPVLHVSKCGALLKQCKRLRHLRLRSGASGC